jgi:hypothetical protein
VFGGRWGPYTPAGDLSHYVPTVPFSFNLGRRGDDLNGSQWDGNIIFGKYYNGNRVAAHKFFKVTGKGDDFLKDGQFTLGSVSYRTITQIQINESAIFDLNDDLVRLPLGYSCGTDNITVTLPKSSFDIFIPAFLLTQRWTYNYVGPITFGRPFFQYVETMVTAYNNIYFAQVHGSDLDIDPLPFFSGDDDENYHTVLLTISKSGPTSTSIFDGSLGMTAVPTSTTRVTNTPGRSSTDTASTTVASTSIPTPTKGLKKSIGNKVVDANRSLWIAVVFGVITLAS